MRGGGGIGGSRYVAVSHENAVRYIVRNKNKKVILIGTSCAISGFANLITKYSLDANNYLLVGLFCDKMMSYDVWNYFSTKATSVSGKLKELIFKTKEKSGWPGDMKLVFENADIYLEKRERLAVKDFFCNRRCLYCADKLNARADISLGDNYTRREANSLGSSCILVRTGKIDLPALSDGQLILAKLEITDLLRSQEIAKKRENIMFMKLHSCGMTTPGIPIGIKFKYLYKLLKILIGNMYGRLPIALKVFSKIECIIKQY